jgi:hypothetical protein
MWLLAVVDGAPSGVRTVTAAGLAAVVQRDDTEVATTELLVRHAAVVASLLEQCDAVLPVRAGTRVSDDEEVRDLLHERRQDLRLGLDRVRGGAELAVRWEPDADGASEPAVDGRTYLAGRVRAWRWADDIVQRVYELGAHADVREVKVLTHSPGSVKASLLVGRAAAGQVKDEVLASGRRVTGSLTCTGPYPPYTFCAPAAEATR